MNGWTTSVHWLAILFLGCAANARTDASPISIGLVLSPGDPELILFQIWSFQPPSDSARDLSLIALEPGPIDLRGGLRLLPNQVVPRLDVPDLLIVVNLGGLVVSDMFLAFIRRCLLENRPVWVVGQLPESISELPLSPGQSILRIDPEDLLKTLQKTFAAGDQGQSLSRAMALCGAR